MQLLQNREFLLFVHIFVHVDAFDDILQDIFIGLIALYDRIPQLVLALRVPLIQKFLQAKVHGTKVVNLRFLAHFLYKIYNIIRKLYQLTDS